MTPFRIVFLSVAMGVLGLGNVARAEPCVIDAPTASIEGVTIQPAGEDAFSITLHRVPIQATRVDKTTASVDVQAPLRFTTKHPLNRLDIELAKRVSLHDGRLILSAGMTPSFLPAGELDRSDAPMQIPLPELSPGEPIAIPCQALTVPAQTAQNSVTPELLVAQKPILHATASGPFPLYSKRQATNPWMITFRGPLTIVRRAGAWVKLQAKWSDGSVLRGWSNSEQLVVQTGVPAVGGLGHLGTTGLGLCGSSHRPRPTSYLLRPNAPIHTRAKGAIWAHTAGTVQVKAFALSRSDGWLQITSIEGLPPMSCSTHQKFWVHADHIQWTQSPL